MDSTNNEQNNQNQNQSENKPAESQPAEQQKQAEQKADPKDVEDNRALTYLSYLGLLFLVPLLAKKESKFAQFHAKQGLVLTVGWFIGSFLMPFLGLGFLVYLVILVLSIMGLLNVNNGSMKELPIVGDLAKKINL
jgi:uncharacterized membrane protein